MPSPASTRPGLESPPPDSSLRTSAVISASFATLEARPVASLAGACATGGAPGGCPVAPSCWPMAFAIFVKSSIDIKKYSDLSIIEEAVKRIK